MSFNQLLKYMPYFIADKHMPKYDFKSIENNPAAKPPQLYNEYGEQMKVFFLRDFGNGPYSLSASRYPRWILWDRFNIALDTHFYVHDNMFKETYDCEKKIGVLRESEEIIPKVFKKAMDNSGIVNDYSLVLTHSDRVLNKYSNAQFAPATYVSYGTVSGGGELSDRKYEIKNKDISIIASDKAMCELHKIRADIARYYKLDERVDCYGKAVGRYIEKKSDALDRYRYSIVVENSVTPFYFTEKILDCFASMTVPIYLGATKIDDFFNTDGIIHIKREMMSDYKNLDSIIKNCCEKDYMSRIDAIKDNYNRVQEYLSYEDYIYKHFDIFRE